MEQSKKFLKIYSYLILALAAFSIAQIVAELFFGKIDAAALTAEIPEGILTFTKYLVLSISFLLTLPSFYVAFKGLKVAKNPDSSKGHIVWATILIVFYIIALIDPAIDIIKKVDVFGNVSRFCSILVEAWIYYDFIRYAKAVAKGVN